MSQHNNEHLSNAQLSAYLDKELAPDELTLCAVHIQTCQTCQAELTDLRLISSLLREMPQVEVPRSFALPLNLKVLPTTPASTVPHVPQPSRSQYILKRSLRALSTIAAVLGLMFILAGLLTALPQRGSMTTAASNSASFAPQHTASTAAGKPQTAMGSATTPATQATKRTPSNTPDATSTPSSTGTSVTVEQGGPPPTQPTGPPPALDPGQPSGRLEIGSALFVLGILGVVLTRRFRRAPTF